MAWHAQAVGGYGETSTEAIENAWEAYGILYAAGWTVEAFCGYWGNVGHEGGYNPWRWQGDHVRYEYEIAGAVGGYGLTQFTPARKYIWSDDARVLPGYGPNFRDKTGDVNDGYAQVVFLDRYADYYPTSAFPISYADYKKTTLDVNTTTEIWMKNYERPPADDPTLPSRQASARYWYQLLSGQTPPDPPVPPSPWSGSQGMSWILWLRNII